LLARAPTTATSLGVDTGLHAGLRGRLDDRSPAGLAANRAFLDDALARLDAVARDGLDPGALTSLMVTQTAFRTAREGMALPYGDATIGGWRNTPYCVIQNVGGWIDIPQVLDGDQPVRDAGDADFTCNGFPPCLPCWMGKRRGSPMRAGWGWCRLTSCWTGPSPG
jgi:uncharacterized protein (DUF885 family)